MKEIASNIFWIETTQDLSQFCNAIINAPVIGLDTEFMRTHTFWPEACLIQIASSQLCAIIDLKAQNIDWTPLVTLLEAPKIMKVLHSGRQDMEIFYHLWKTFPTPLFDTQMAANMCGYDGNISYENLVQQELGITLDKTQQFSNWSRRPLSQMQLFYAAADVLHLPNLYATLKGKIGIRSEWMQEDLQPLYNPHLYAPQPHMAWKRFRSGRPQSLKFMKALQKLSAWREALAQSQNIARKRVLKDGILLELCNRRPTTIEALQEGSLAQEISETYYEEIIQHIQRSQEEELVERPVRGRRYKEEHIDALKTLASEIAMQHAIPLQIIATKKDFEALAAQDPNARCMQGWRYEIFGSLAKELLSTLQTKAPELEALV